MRHGGRATPEQRGARRIALADDEDSALIGRGAELKRLGALMARGGALCIHGAPGVGKSRLARAALREHGVGACWSVALGEVREADDVVRAVLASMGALYAEGQTAPGHAVRRLAAVLDGAPAGWLLLDDCAEALEALESLRGSIPAHINLLMTAYQAPGWEDAALALDVLPHDPTRADNPALALLLERAGERVPGWSPDAQELASLAQIASQLGGLPLALEIAASRLAMIKPARLAARLLDEGGDMIGMNPALSRTLSAAWSPLSDPQRRIILALARSPDGLDLAALGASPDEVPSAWVRSKGGRLEVLHSVRVFALGQPGADDPALFEALEARLRAQSRALEARMAGVPWSAEVAQLGRESRNLTAALARAQTIEARVELWFGLASALWRRGDIERARAGLEGLFDELDRGDVVLDADLEVRLCRMASYVVGAQWSPALVKRFHERALSLRAQASPALIAHVLWQRADACTDLGELAAAEEAAAQASALAEVLDEPELRARAARCRARLALMRSALDEARSALGEAAAIWEGMPDRQHMLASVLFNLSFVLQQQQALEEALAPLKRALELFEEAGHIVAQLHVLRMLSDHALDMGDPCAEEVALRLLDGGRQHGLVWAIASAEGALGQLALLEGAHERAEALLGSAASRAVLMGVRSVASSYTFLLALIAEGRGDAATSRRHLEQVWEALPTMRLPLPRAHILGTRALCAARDGDAAQRDEALSDLQAEALRSPQAAAACALYKLWISAVTAPEDKDIYSLLSLAKYSHDLTISCESSLRILRRLVMGVLPSKVARRWGLMEVRGESLLLDEEAPGFLVPGGQEWVELELRQIPWRLLCALARARRAGEAASYAALLEAVWPGERIRADAARNRLHVTVAALRGLGLRELIVSTPGGVALAEGVEVRAC